VRELCPFCRRDPYEWVDIGVGYQAVAVTCCGLGNALLHYGDPKAIRILKLLESNDKRRQRRGERWKLRLM
jgi:hypothetical protein